MENTKIKKLEPKEWLDRVIDNLDQLRILDKVLRPDGVGITCLDLANYTDQFPPLHICSDNVRFFAARLNLPIERTVSDCFNDTVKVETFITYREHHVYGIEFISREEASKL